MCSLLVKRKKNCRNTSNSCTLLCHFYPTHFSLSEQSPSAFRLLPGSFQSCSQQISCIFCVEVRVWYICSKSTSITQPTGGRWKERKIRQKTNFFTLPENSISTVSNSGLCEEDTLVDILVQSCLNRFSTGTWDMVKSINLLCSLWGVGSQHVARLAQKVSSTN